MKETLTIEEKWQVVRDHFEACYRHPESNLPIRFRTRIKDEQIEFLYDQLRRLDVSERKHRDRKRLVDNVYFL